MWVDDDDFRRLEGRLYGLRGSPTARIASPRVASPKVRSPGPRGPFREIEARLDLTFAVRSLDPDDVRILRDHYIEGTRSYPCQVRRRVIKRLGATLDRLE